MGKMQNCRRCEGDGVCRTCKTAWDSSNCTSCSGSKNCSVCNGVGEYYCTCDKCSLEAEDRKSGSVTRGRDGGNFPRGYRNNR